MKRLVIVFLLMVGFAASQPQDNFPVIRQTGQNVYHDIVVRKFEDGLNTCYVVHAYVYGGQSSAISCVKR